MRLFESAHSMNEIVKECFKRMIKSVSVEKSDSAVIESPYFIATEFLLHQNTCEEL